MRELNQPLQSFPWALPVEMTANTLVAVVSTLATPSHPLASAPQVRSYCGSLLPPIDCGQSEDGRHFRLGELADIDEGRNGHRLQKFKVPGGSSARVAWCLTEDVDAGRAWADKNGWLLVPWNRKDGVWAWQEAGPALTTIEFLVS